MQTREVIKMVDKLAFGITYEKSARKKVLNALDLCNLLLKAYHDRLINEGQLFWLRSHVSSVLSNSREYDTMLLFIALLDYSI